MESIFNIVLITSIYATIVGLAILMIKGVLKNRLNAKWHYVIWIVLIIKLLIPFGPQSPFSLFNAVPKVSVQNVQSISNTIDHQYKAYFEANPSQGSAMQQSSGIIQAKEAKKMSMLPYAWFAGVVLMLMWLGMTYWLLYNKLQKDSAPPDERLQRILQQCKIKMGIKIDIPIMMQQIIGMPSLFGAFHPKILLSPQALQLNDKELEYILLHELAHYKRKDIYMNYLLLAFQSIHWFNPVIWYCFHKLRQDMEIAADEQVLVLLQDNEHRDYGKALLAILEGFSSPALAPKLLAMAVNKKNIEKRIRMIKMADFFKRRGRAVIAVGLLCLVLLGGALLTNGIGNKEELSSEYTIYNAEELFKYKTDYVGDNSKVAGIIHNLPYGEYVKQISLQTGSKPYGIIVDYEFPNAEMETEFLDEGNAIRNNNATIVFSMVGNADQLEFYVPKARQSYNYTREVEQKGYPDDLRVYAKSSEDLKSFLHSFVFKVKVDPSKYALFMSSAPGIHIKAVNYGDADVKEVTYYTDKGALLTWQASSGKIDQGGQSLQLPIGESVYWTPAGGEDSMISAAGENIVKIAFLDGKGKKLAEQSVVIVSEDGMYYNVKPAPGLLLNTGNNDDGPTSIEEAVSGAIKAKADSYRKGEAAVEGHVILQTEEKGAVIKVYTVASIGNFSFENGIFTKISGSGSIPTVITLSNEAGNKYSLIDYQEPLDGSGYTESIKKLFPKNLHNKVLKNSVYGDALVAQQEAQAAAYLKSIGRDAEVQYHVEKVPVKINVDASNKLFAETAKYDAFINNCPYWIGSVEQIENGTRYLYETIQEKTSDGHDLVVFRKKNAEGTIVKEVKYKIVGSEPQLMK